MTGVAHNLLEAGQALNLLREVVARATDIIQRGDTAIAVFDLDSTLLNNAPRQAKIMRDYGEKSGAPALTQVTHEHWDGWDAKIPMRAVGLEPSEIDEHFDAFRDYWRQHFFTSALCVEDQALLGGPEYVLAVLATGARVYYVTGRHEGMQSGTMTSFKNAGYPIPDDPRIQLLMKPSLEEHDDVYKARTYQVLRESGSVVAAFDNEPAHINGYRSAFPDALSVHLDTDHSLRDIKVDQGIPSISGFECWLELD